MIGKEELKYVFFAELFAQLNPAEQEKIISEIKAILSER